MWQSEFYPESRFGGFTDVDGTISFYVRVQSLLPDDGVALDIGCGRGTLAEDPVPVRRELRLLKKRARRVIGLDVDTAAASNPFIDEFHLISDGAWPVESNTVDVAVADWVLEHVPNPPHFFAEAFRVLKPGGHLCMRTSNARSLIGLMSRLIPNRSHAQVLQRVQHDREAHDVFPTVHRCNTRGRMKSAMRAAGFSPIAVYGVEGQPSYHDFSKLAYVFGVFQQRATPNALRSALFAFAAKPNG